MNPLADIPGYLEAVNRENESRDLAFLDVPESICGIDILQMTPRHLVMLDRSNNPFLFTPAPVDPDLFPQLVVFLWALSPDYVMGEGAAKTKFVKSCRKLKFISTVQAVETYVKETFQDAPTREESNGYAPSYTSFVASLVDLLASEYGWSEAEIFNMPLKRIFQYLRRIEIRHGAKVMFNPSDKIKGDWLDRINKGMSEYMDDLNKPYRWENN